MSKNKTKNKKSGISEVANKVKEKNKNQSSENGDVKTRQKISHVLSDGTLVDMVYNPDTLETGFAVFERGKTSIAKKVKLNKTTWLVPLPPGHSLIENNFILFPSEPVEYGDDSMLFEEVKAFINKYMELPESFLSVVATYVMMTWLYDRFTTLPYLRVVGIYGTGKTRVLEVTGHLCYKAMMAGGSITTAALFRTLDSYNGTLVFDEADLNDMDSKEMLRVLRQGHNAGFSVTRMDTTANGKFYTRSFNVFGPKIMASKEKSLDAALESRCLSQYLYPLEKNTRPIELSLQFKQEALKLRNKLLMFRFNNFGKVLVSEKVIQDIKLPRMKQTGLAVVTIANLIGEKLLNEVIGFLKDYEKELNMEQADSVENDILLCIFKIVSDGDLKKSGKLRIGADLTNTFNGSFYDNYSNKETKTYETHTGPLEYQAYRVSAKKMGGYIRKMGIRSERDKDGFYIPIYREYPKICSLAKRYGLDSIVHVPENAKEVKDSTEKLSQKEKSSSEAEKDVVDLSQEQDDEDEEDVETEDLF